MIVTVDCGSTNMRCCLFQGDALIDELRAKTGDKKDITETGMNQMEASFKTAIEALLSRNRILCSDVEMIVAAGILASDVGIYRVPHVLAPAGLTESAKAAKAVVLDQISTIPILFIPGVRTLPAEDVEDEALALELLESMSGEECELYGIAASLGLKGDFVAILPGSYNKALDVDFNGRIASIRSGMCGDFIAAVSMHTVLRHSLPSPVIRRIIPEKLIMGYEYCAGHGVSPSLLKARMGRVFRDWSEDEAANFFVGVLLYDDVRTSAELCISEKPAVIGGSNPLKEIFRILLEHVGVKQLYVVDDAVAERATAFGALAVYRKYRELHDAKESV